MEGACGEISAVGSACSEISAVGSACGKISAVKVSAVRLMWRCGGRAAKINALILRHNFQTLTGACRVPTWAA